MRSTVAESRRALRRSQRISAKQASKQTRMPPGSAPPSPYDFQPRPQPPLTPKSQLSHPEPHTGTARKTFSQTPRGDGNLPPPIRPNHRAPRPKWVLPPTESRVPCSSSSFTTRTDSARVGPNANVRLNASRRPKPISAAGPMGLSTSTVGKEHHNSVGKWND